jgi:hypothetical protein
MAPFQSTSLLSTMSGMFTSFFDSKSKDDEMGQGPEAETTEAKSVDDVINGDSTAALLMDVMAEADKDNQEVVKALLRERVREIKRLENLLSVAKADLQNLLQKSPEEIAHSAAISPNFHMVTQAAAKEFADSQRRRRLCSSLGDF